MQESDRSGFTLLEVLLAVVISALVISVAVAALRGFIGFRDRIEKAYRREGSRALFYYFLFKQLQNVPIGEEGVGNLCLYGERNFFRFISRVPMSGYFLPGLVGVEYRIDGNRLYERDYPLRNEVEASRFLTGTLRVEARWVRIRGVGILAFEYLGVQGWRDRWNTVSECPKAVRVLFSKSRSLDVPVMVQSWVRAGL